MSRLSYRWQLVCGVGAALLGCSGSDLTFPADPVDGSTSDSVGGDSGLEGPCTLSVCGGRCVDTSSDPSHCGGCGKACGGATPACVAGACACPPSGRCGGGGGTCLDVTSDAENCGACGRRCGASEVCVAGACVCRAGTIACAGGCVDGRADFANCGGCGKACVTGQRCAGGLCVAGGCGSGLTECESAGGNVCVNTATSNSHCGSCGRRCDGATACIGGDCRDYAPAPFCKACPCPGCAGDKAMCCPPMLAGANAFCVESKTCPTP